MIPEKEIFEEYARHAVSFLLGLPLRDLLNSDRPDLQSAPCKIGIEVTRAISQEQAIAEKEMVRKQPYGLFRPDILWPEGRGVYVSDPKIHAAPEEYAYLVARIADKSVKFDGYTRFDLNGLYCFVPSEQLEHTANIIERCVASPFDTVLFDCVNSIYVWQRHKTSLTQRLIDVKLRRRWSRRSRRLIRFSQIPLFQKLIRR